MPLIWAAISGHGYGHAAQVVPVLNTLSRLVPELTVILRTTVPESFFRNRLTVPWVHQPVQQDVGCVQKGPLEIDVPATWNELAHFHTAWDARVADEAAAMRSHAPRLILADTPYLASEAGHRAGIPVVALANFTWIDVLTPFMTPGTAPRQAIIDTISHSYRHATLALRIEPGLPLGIFRTVRAIGPIADPAVSRRTALRRQLGAGDDEHVVLVGFGGIPLASLPWSAMGSMDGYRFICDGAVPANGAAIHAQSSLPFGFKDVFASVDIVITKPGYGTTVEAVMMDIPVVYVRRHNFADEPPLVTFLQRYGRAAELSMEDFLSGRWKAALAAVRSCPRPAEHPPAPTGADDAAALLVEFF